MVEAALLGIGKSVLKQLASPALQEFKLLWDHKADLEKLENTVATINDVLEDADSKQATNVAVRGWIARLRIVLYEADDLFDIISAKILAEKNNKGSQIGEKVRRFVSKPYNFAFLVKTAHKVKSIRERMDDIAHNMIGFNFLSVQTNFDPTSSIIGREETHSFIPRYEVMGRDQEREYVVSMLLPDSSQELKGISVISIIGIGGLGKTTLAKLVYNDERVQRGFGLCLWACIKYFTSLKQVLRALLKSATEREPQDLHPDQLQSLFRKKIQGKRFLLVLDDVWDDNPRNWLELKRVLSSGEDGSMVLTTTRKELVAKSLSAIEPYFHLRGISDKHAWLLFKKTAFEEERDQISSEWEQLGRQIVHKCANVPLAIVVIASLLKKEGKETWFSLLNDELSSNEEIMDVLEFSYKELPYPIKRCFGYCSLFPKDYEFKMGRLVHLWIAQGFIEPSRNQSMEDRARKYFFYLVKRCFFQLTLDKVTKQVTYRMHDLMHDLATKVAGSESILVDETAQVSWKNNVRHVSINCESESMVDHVCSFSHSKSLRTFLHPCKHSMEKNALRKLMSSFKSLRVLDLSNLRIEELPVSIGEMIHLRFLDLSKNYMERLPSSVCSLCHLQYLILYDCTYLTELPENLGNLLSLRHLLLQDCDSLVKMPLGLVALTSLVTLDRLVVHNLIGGLKYLENLDNLSGSLKIELPTTGWQNATTDVERSFLSKKSKLHTLQLFRTDYNYSRGSSELDAIDTSICALEPPPNLVELRIRNFDGHEMPQWVACLDNLVTLKLERCRRCVELPPLSRLPSLEKLFISDMDSMKVMEDSKFYKPDLFYPSLKTLSIKKMSSLTSWWLQGPTVLPAFPRVTNVVIQDCPKLTRCMPLFPLGENFPFEGVGEDFIWQVIGREATSGTSQGNCSKLKSVVISDVGDLSSIAEAQITHLSALRGIRINNCDKLETVSCGIAYLPSLERLVIWGCPKLNNWVDLDDQKTEVRKIHLSSRLTHLEIPTVNRNLFKGLKYMASLQTLIIYQSFNQELQEEEEEGEKEEEGMPWKHLQKLRRMELVFGETYSMRSNQRLLHGFQHLTSLQELNLCKCKELYLSWRALLGLNHLQILTIEDVEEVICVDSDALVQTRPISKSIRELTCGSGEWVNAIPWKSFPFLEELEMWNLKSLPEGVQHLATLQLLIIKYIGERVVSLPHWMSSLSSLRYLSISGSCSELKKRCERLTGEDWPKIQHIHRINIE